MAQRASGRGDEAALLGLIRVDCVQHNRGEADEVAVKVHAADHSVPKGRRNSASVAGGNVSHPVDGDIARGKILGVVEVGDRDRVVAVDGEGAAHVVVRGGGGIGEVGLSGVVLRSGEEVCLGVWCWR